jgi:adenine-specific DNA-methyltransferase
MQQASKNGKSDIAQSTSSESNIEQIQLIEGDCRKVLLGLKPGTASLILTSPPYNIGKEYEKHQSIEAWTSDQKLIIGLAIRALHDGGSICWQVGNYVNRGEILPLDSIIIALMREAGLKIRNRIVWTFGHGLHCKKRLSGRHETVIWATKGDDYTFNLDPIRIPQKYPQKKYYKGPKKGQLSGHPLGKNPGDVWEITNVKHRHPEKTAHPCQFPEELVRRFMLALSDPGDLVIDPYAGSGTTGVVAQRLKRKAILIERNSNYVSIARARMGINLEDHVH